MLYAPGVHHHLRKTAGLTGPVFLGNVVVDVPLSDTMFVVAPLSYGDGALRRSWPCSAEIYHWYPKVTGRMLNEGCLDDSTFWVSFPPEPMRSSFPMHYLGIFGHALAAINDIGETSFIPGIRP